MTDNMTTDEMNLATHLLGILSDLKYHLLCFTFCGYDDVICMLLLKYLYFRLI